MARGYPDFFGVSVFPMYGGSREEAGTVNATPNDTIELFRITGKGCIYHIQFRTQGFASVVDDSISLWIDDVEYYTLIFAQELRENKVLAVKGGWVVTNYTADTFHAHAFFQGEVSYSTNFYVTYTETGGNASGLLWRARYALIT